MHLSERAGDAPVFEPSSGRGDQRRDGPVPAIRDRAKIDLSIRNGIANAGRNRFSDCRCREGTLELVWGDDDTHGLQWRREECILHCSMQHPHGTFPAMSFTLQIGAAAPEFNLPGVDGKQHRLADSADAKLLVIAFSCNHCPYVIGSEDRMIAFAKKYAPTGVHFVAINSNETELHPTDSFEHMVQKAKEKNFPFAYLRDDSQDVALTYGALRTPHYYLFAKDAAGKWTLRYTGRMDDNPRNPGKETTHELADAVDDLLAGRKPRMAVTNPIGCNVKWRGKPHKWMPPEACDLV
jgi:peroxiredoxin